MWATRLHPDVSVIRFMESLERHDFATGAGVLPERLAVYDQAKTGQRIIFVYRTGRIQIRLDALTRHEERVEAARCVYDVLRRATFEAAGLHPRRDSAADPSKAS